ncbi:MAG: type II toxin-antitoxin system Phd/YefM family antitoxin [Anaerolineales bacterium]
MAEDTKQKVIPMTELHRQLGRVIRKVALSDEHFVVEKGGLPVAVLMSYHEYEQIIREVALNAHRDLVRALGSEAERQGLTEEQLMEEIEETKKQVYQEWKDLEKIESE